MMRTWSSPLDWLNVRSAGPGKAPPPASRPSLKFSLATVCGSFEMDPSLELSLFSTGCWSLLPSSPPSPSLRVSLDSDSEGEVALSASVAISIGGEPESLLEDPKTLFRLVLASANWLAGNMSTKMASLLLEKFHKIQSW